MNSINVRTATLRDVVHVFDADVSNEEAECYKLRCRVVGHERHLEVKYGKVRRFKLLGFVTKPNRAKSFDWLVEIIERDPHLTGHGKRILEEAIRNDINDPVDNRSIKQILRRRYKNDYTHSVAYELGPAILKQYLLTARTKFEAGDVASGRNALLAYVDFRAAEDGAYLEISEELQQLDATVRQLARDAP